MFLLALSLYTCILFSFPTALTVALPKNPQPKSPSATSCRCFPSDPCWPTLSEWHSFNKTLGGKLIATIPLASPCHNDPFAAFNATRCAELQSTWDFPETHYTTSSSIMAPFPANRSCDPFLPRGAGCVIGTLIQYAVNASSTTDYQNTITFAKEHNIRLVIRNTGHDYFGKSTGAGGLGIWTHNIKNKKVLNYKSTSRSGYSGKALKLGAGIQNFEAQQFAHDNGLIVVGGNCPTVGLVGGYTQGGGHGPLASTFGLGADQVLEWEVVTGAGHVLTVTPTNENADLYWALSGGGGGTYGVVFSATVKAYEDRKTAAANLTFANTDSDVFFLAAEMFTSILPALVDAGAVSIWYLTNTAFEMVPTTGPGMTKSQLQGLLQPFLNKLNESKISYSYFIDEFPTYLDSYHAMNPPTNVSNIQIGGRLIPRQLVQSENSALIKALRNITEQGGIISGLSINVYPRPGAPENSVNRAWRDAIFDAVIGTSWSTTDWDLNIANQDLMTNALLPQLERLTPGGGAYLNEGDPQQPDFQQVFYGNNYEKLKDIKNKYDPEGIFYALTAVGSDEWVEKDDGRLCRVGYNEI